MTKERLEALRNEYPTGTRIELIEMNDPYSPVSSGTMGSVALIDDAGHYE